MVTICMVPHASPAPALIDKSSATARPPEVMTFLEPDWPTGCNSSSCPTNWWRSTAEEHLLPGKEIFSDRSDLPRSNSLDPDSPPFYVGSNTHIKC
ncbi:hypothetical protein Bca4012_013181 [Brassica carinata]